MTGGGSARRFFRLALGLFVISLSGPFAEGAVFYVTQKGAGIKDGSSWANACGEARFPVVLSETRAGAEFWIAKGRYRPDTQGRVDRSFVLPPGVALYGGFSGFENSVEQRNPEVNLTVLTGDLALDDAVNSHGVTEKAENIKGDNSLTVLKCTGDPAAAVLPERYGTLIDGLVITAGKADSSSASGGIQIKHASAILCQCSFTGNLGGDGGAVYSEKSSIWIKECTFAGNTGSEYWGGAVFGKESISRITGSTFSGNTGNIGGCISNCNGTSRITGCTFSSNNSLSGGAISNETSSGFETDMNITDCMFSSNRAQISGGGISNTGGEITVSKCNFIGNRADREGGGISNESGKMTVEACTFIANESDFLSGGGITNWYGDVVAENCIFWGNRAGSSAGSGGGIVNNVLGNFIVENCTFHKNSAKSGGALANWNTMVLRNCTLYGNSATEGDELFAAHKDILGSQDSTKAVNCIFWNANSGDVIFAEQYNSFDITHSIVRGGFSGTGNLDVDPLLGSLAFNGGFTMTCALLPGSPAIDSGTSAGTPEKDQRGVDRPQKSGFDRGAYEVYLRKFLVMKAPFPGAFRFSSEAEEFESGEGTAWGFPEGLPVTVTFLPETGKAVKDVLVDRQSIGAVRSYTFPNLDRDHEIEVVFMDASASSGGGCSASGTGIFAFLLILPAALLGRRR